ncbi:MAG: tRNA (adenosine(37)-N6)-dimethylallyltransferase MiaA [Peptococcaceae bacterium]|nr:tRNA (adenosine(37)-N6)-dimethylallyltransferase MiaA [Peptococcaceae bacterium]
MVSSNLIAVVGPTASGKSSLAVRLALALGGEVISGDSMQIYKGMDIGTAKVTAYERCGIPHHLLDLREPSESFSAAEYQVLARQAAQEILNKGKTPILAGGTGLYIDSALYNYTYTEEDTKTPIRETLLAEAKEKGSGALWEKLKQLDPGSAEKLHPNDTKRIMRALEYISIHGKPISENRFAYDAREQMFDMILLGLDLPRDLLYQRIDSRVDLMMEAGFLDEVRTLQDQGLRPDSQAGQAIGYKQLLCYLRQEGQDISLDQAVGSIKQESRRYAKRQLTWFRRNKSIIWLDASKTLEDDASEKMAEMLRESFAYEDSGDRASCVVDFVRRQGLFCSEE